MDWKSFLGDTRTRRWLWVSLIIGIVLRLAFLWSRSIWFDEAASIFVAQQGYGSILTSLGHIDFNPPLYFLMLHTWMLISTHLPWVKLLSALIGIAGIPVIYRWGKVLYNERVGLFAAFFFAIACLQIRYAQEIRMYAPAVLLVLLSNYYFAKVTREERFRKGYSTWAKYILFTTLALYTHYYVIFNVVVQNAYLLWRYRDKGIRKLWLISQAITALLYTPWLWSLWQQLQNLQTEFWIPRPSFATLVGIFIYLGDNVVGFLALAILALGGVLSLYHIREGKVTVRSEQRNFFLVGLIVLPIAITFMISLVSQSVFYERYFIIFAPALYLLAAKGVSHLSNRMVRWGFLAAVGVAMTISLVPYYQSANTDMDDAVHAVLANRLPNDLVVHATPATFLPFQVLGSSDDYLLSSKKLPAYLGGTYYPDRVYLKSILEIVGKEAKRVTFIDGAELNPKIQRAMQGVGEQESQQHFGKISATTYRITIDRDKIIQEANASIAGLGFKLQKEEGTLR